MMDQALLHDNHFWSTIKTKGTHDVFKSHTHTVALTFMFSVLISMQQNASSEFAPQLIISFQFTPAAAIC